MKPRRVAWLVARVVLLAAAAVFLVRTASPHWPAISRARIEPQWGLLTLASLIWLGSFVFLVLTWSWSLRWWNERLGPLAALRIFFVSNLARYIPGTLWQFAGLAAMSVAYGVSPLSASGGILLQQLVLLATGFVLSMSLAPSLLAQLGLGVNSTLQVAGMILGLAALAWLLPVALPVLKRWLERVLKRSAPLPMIPARQLVAYVLRCALGWIGYALAFWIFARALLGPSAPDPLLASAAFIASYVLGILAVFAPGGLVVREAALVVALTPAIGADNAVILALLSRLWLVGLEIIGAAAFLGAGGSLAAERRRL